MFTDVQITRFWNAVEKRGPDECWEWKRGRQRAGYGALYIAPKVIGAHRIAYELANGPIQNGLSVLHRCDNPPCCNPAHLFLGTDADNTKDRISKGRTKVLRGEDAARAILTEEQVKEIRASYKPYETTHQLLADVYGVSRTAIRSVVDRRNWRHVP